MARHADMLARFWVAVAYFTRLPVPVQLDPAANQGASSFLPLVGYLVAGVGLLVGWLAALVLPPSMVVVLMVAAVVVITGAMHEDAWSDFCDGFGGWNREQTLRIMRDSRSGAFAVVGLVVLLLTRVLVLLELYRWSSSDSSLSLLFALIFVTGHTLSRFVAVSFMATHDYADSDQPSRAKPMTAKLAGFDLGFAAAAGVTPLVGLMLYQSMLLGGVLVAVLLVRLVFSRWFDRRLGGYTGDCLGAAQQASEVVVYLTLLALLPLG